jgi:H+-transporting ATPase
METAAIIAIALLDYADFALIVGLLLLNSTISFVEESSADAAIKVKILRMTRTNCEQVTESCAN